MTSPQKSKNYRLICHEGKLDLLQVPQFDEQSGRVRHLSKRAPRWVYVESVGAARDSPRSNLTEDPFVTDGILAVMFIANQPVRATKLRQSSGGSRFQKTDPDTRFEPRYADKASNRSAGPPGLSSAQMVFNSAGAAALLSYSC